MKSVFGQEVVGWEDFPDNQLLRCPRQKAYEADLLLTIPVNSSFVDVGAHFGDTVVSLSLFAKANKRPDIRFFAFEPSKKKCDHIIRIAEANGLCIVVINTAVGDKKRTVVPDGQYDQESGQCIYKEQAHEYKGPVVPMVTLDDFAAAIQPVGFIHIDTEGWDAKCLAGSNTILQNPINCAYIVAELWTAETSIRNGFSLTPEKDILSVMCKHQHYGRRNNMIDEETNIVFFPAKQIQKMKELMQLVNHHLLR